MLKFLIPFFLQNVFLDCSFYFLVDKMGWFSKQRFLPAFFCAMQSRLVIKKYRRYNKTFQISNVINELVVFLRTYLVLHL